MNRDLELAREAWKVIEDVKDARREVKTRAEGLPVLIRTSGLAATAAFMKARSIGGDKPALESAYRSMYGALQSRVFSECVDGPAPMDLLEWLGEVDTATYARATRAARDLSDWLKRAAQAEITEPDGDS